MSLDNRTTNDLIRIAVAGGGMRLNGSARTTDDLIRIAVAAKGSESKVYLSGLGSRTTEDLIRISVAGAGIVVFE